MTKLHQIKASVLQGSVLGPMLYIIFSLGLPDTRNVLIGTFADDTAILAVDVDETLVGVSCKLQYSLNEISKWLQDSRIKINESKSIPITFTIKRETCPGVVLNPAKIP